MTNTKDTAYRDNFELQPGMHLHLVGIGGAGISAIAQVLQGRGYQVSGSDMQANALTAALAQAGVVVYQGHHARQIAGADAVIISSAVSESNPEVAAARAAGIPVLKRADFLGHLMAGDIGVAIAGTHGKTTTTGMIAQILLDGELDPTLILGGVLPSLGTNGRFGSGGYFVIEADEYDHMFLGLRPEVAVLTNIEHDHPDIFPTHENYLQAFADFVQLLPPHGRLIACVDDMGVCTLLDRMTLPNVEITTYSVAEDGVTPAHAADFQALDIRPNPLGGVDFLVQQEGQLVGLARLRLPGHHNVRNALAAIIVGLDSGVDFSTMRQTLADFGGVGRRFQVIGEAEEVTIIDDYAHHPTEIRVTLQAARQRYPGRRLWAVWQPHTYSRMKLLQTEFATCFQDADRVVALDIYRSRENDTLGMDTAVIVKAMNHPQVVHIPQREEAATYILDRVRRGDVVLTLGAGDGNEVGAWVLAGLQKRFGV